jgi:hypothetical protein
MANRHRLAAVIHTSHITFLAIDGDFITDLVAFGLAEFGDY